MRLALPLLLVLMLGGCKSASHSEFGIRQYPGAESSPATNYPARPTISPPAFKVVHQDNDTLTLITAVDATDDQIASILWAFHDAFKTHGFDALKLPQSFIDARHPKVWVHVYRGAKCADEKYTRKAYPCGASYHGAGDYTVGSYKDPNFDEAVLHKADAAEVQLWDSGKAAATR